MKNIIITMATTENHKNILAQTLGLMRKYSNRIGAELKVITSDDHSFRVPHYRKLKLISDALQKGNRVAWIDSDVLISEKAPDIFQEVPEDAFGIFNEGIWDSRVDAMEGWTKLTGFQFPNPAVYYNTGVMVASPQHADIFKVPDVQIFHFGEQTYLNQKITEANCKIHELSHHWNRMSITHMPLGEEPFCSNFIHFAGETERPDLPNFIKRTVEEWKNKSWTGDKRIVIVTGGGMGNQVATLPVIEYIAKQHPEYTFTIQSAFPEVFNHLASDKMEIFDRFNQAKYPFALVKSTQYNHANGAPPVYDVFCHPTDYHSLVLFNKQLPLEEKRIKLPTKDCGVKLPPNTVAVHAGRSGWKSKEMPKEYWQKIVDILKNHGCTVALIGTKHFLAKSDKFNPASPETSPKENEWGCFDLDNVDYKFLEASFAETCDVIRQCKFLLTNDSMPVHAAGAFDNYIGLISIAKRPDLIFPYRGGNNSDKTMSWVGKPYWGGVADALMYAPGQTYNIAEMHNWMEWPNPEQVAIDIVNCVKS